ncbi:hypothetical protein [Massilia sp. DWR3-1-1]|uniref:hypothetical protein n=1 Tax=Massilia sp. DWR3-1-1 TaxID=2804559 RepID=UPI003CF26B0F
MASGNLGALVVSLEANMAKFNSDMGAAAKQVDQSMTTMAASTKLATDAVKKLEGQANNAKSAAISLAKGMILGAAVGMSYEAITGKIMGVISTMANLKTLSEKTGASVENLSKLAFISKQSGSDIEAVTAALAKMSKGMAGADNETKGAGLALNYLGVSAKDSAGNLKDPAVMFTEIAKKLYEYEDGAGKAAIAQALFGKAGADMLPTLKMMGEQGDIVAKVTTEQATAARQYARDMAKLEAQQGMLFKTVAVALLPALSDFSAVLLEASKNTNVVNAAGKSLADDNSIEGWADTALVAVSYLIDNIRIIGNLVPAVASSFKVVWNDIKLMSTANPAAMAFSAAKGNNPFADVKIQLAERDRDLDAANAKWNKFLAMDVAATRHAAEQKIAARKQKQETEGYGVDGSGGKKANFNTAGEDGAMQAGADKTAREAARIAKLGTTGKLKALEDAYAAERSQIAFQSQYMQEERNQGLISLDAYNAGKLKAINDGLAAALSAYDKEIAVLEKARAASTDKPAIAQIDNQIAEREAAKTKARTEASQALQLNALGLGAAQADLNKTMKEWDIQQDKANAQMKFSNSLYGKSALEVQQLTAAHQAELDVEEKIRMAKKNGSITDESIAGYLADAKAKSAAAGKFMTQGAVQQIVANQRTPAEIEQQNHTDLMKTLMSSKDGELEAIANGNLAIERENARHQQVMVDIRAQEGLQTLALAGNSADQLYNLLANAGMQQTALGKALFIASKAIAVAEIIMNTEVAAAKALAVGGPIFGPPLSIGIRALGYASAGIVIGTTIASAEGGYDIPGGVNPVTQLHEKEMVLPKGPADVIRGLAANGGGAGAGFKLTLVNNGTQQRVVESKQVAPDEWAMIVEDAVNATAAAMSEPNSRTSASLKRNFNVQRSR